MALNLQTTNQMGGRSLVDASNNPILKSILEGTAALQVDPVSQKPKGKKENVRNDGRKRTKVNRKTVDNKRNLK